VSGAEVARKGRKCGVATSWSYWGPALGSRVGPWGKLSKDLDAWVGLWKYDFWVNLDKWMKRSYLAPLAMAFCLSFMLTPGADSREFSKAGQIFQDVKDGVVTIFAAAGTGSGFLVNSNGLILTNNHVVNESNECVRVKFQQDQVVSAEIVARDRQNDLAILRVNLDELPAKPTLKLFDPAGQSEPEAVVGEKVIAVGSPLEPDLLARTMSEGVVGKVSADAVYHDAAIDHGSSGGPLLNFDGQVIGVNSSGFGSRGPGCAIPISTAKSLLLSAEKAISSSPPPSSELLPDISSVKYPIAELIQSNPGFFQKRKQARYNFSSSYFAIACLTPPQSYFQAVKLQDKILSSRARRAAKKGFKLSEDEFDYKNLSKYKDGDPVVTFLIMPVPKLTGSSIAINLLVGAPVYNKHEYRKDFMKAALVNAAGSLMALPLRATRTPMEKNDVEITEYTQYELIDKSYMGIYSFDPKIFKGASKLKILIESEGDKKSITVPIPERVVQAINEDFEPYWLMSKTADSKFAQVEKSLEVTGGQSRGN
jgi:Trypsin-like peptidase domain